jgi:hypothetical protein
MMEGKSASVANRTVSFDMSRFYLAPAGNAESFAGSGHPRSGYS